MRGVVGVGAALVVFVALAGVLPRTDALPVKEEFAALMPESLVETAYGTMSNAAISLQALNPITLANKLVDSATNSAKGALRSYSGSSTLLSLGRELANLDHDGYLQAMLDPTPQNRFHVLAGLERLLQGLNGVAPKPAAKPEGRK